VKPARAVQVTPRRQPDRTADLEFRSHLDRLIAHKDVMTVLVDQGQPEGDPLVREIPRDLRQHGHSPPDVERRTSIWR
jgi:hypothetical protein